jgi:hypothetical protein
MSKLSQNIEDFLQEFLQEFLKLLVLIAKCLRSKKDGKDYQNSTKTQGYVTKKIKL